MTGTSEAAETGAATALPTHAAPRGADPIETLLEDRDAAGDEGPAETRGGLSEALELAYDGDLRIPLPADRPAVVANFVETLDGVVALDHSGRTGGGEVSGFSPTDRFVMGLLRALADIVLVGAGTIRASEGGGWTAPRVFPPRAADYRALRRALGLAPEPTTLIATATGRLDPTHPVFADPDIPVVVTGPRTALASLRAAGLPAHVELESLPDDVVTGETLVAVAARRGAGLVLCEGGPHLVAALVEAGVLDELFLTLAPQLAGRDAASQRLSLVEGLALWPDLPRWGRLASVRRAGDHLFLRYRLTS
ncbi:MAG TPA: dihydrofolate reductase family protein [Candidatus Limnocylindrales bacterium]